mmetsp:Transcript_42073/g.116210  ORF Transcript_42073/g.116210 Transcript_42073/m.116210 type:complete len:546 (+) Transcript_42073:65-1702(+)|eukprot:CAMPEP_0117550402 /NCGR_PEP_ID=MMETSP0784-20121206/48663_1 /TAXON_ID=39447 /ORGANISM="" /LENGTH=545 /DNA_ID=CAMNT_0005347421 /DNA_START=64 /DNA_END=1701 /DNA_ORIENTATION=-
MEATPELFAKLAHRRAVVEGAQARIIEPHDCRPGISMSAPTPGERKLEMRRQPQRNRVRVPDWVVDNRSAPKSSVSSPTHSPRRLATPRSQGVNELGGSRWTPRTDSTIDGPRDESQRLRALEQERDAAWGEVAAARDSAAKRSVELNAEAAKLRSLAKTLEAERGAARQEALRWRCRRDDAHDRGEALAQDFDRAGELPSLRCDLNDMSEDFQRQVSDTKTLQLRVESLSEELARQHAARKHIEEKLVEKCVQTDLLRLQLRMLDDEAAASKPLRHRSRHAGIVPALNLPGGQKVYDLAGSFDSTQLEASVRDADGHDLEFAYDWGLQLSGRMSVERALSVARRAAHDYNRPEEGLLSRQSTASGSPVTADADAREPPPDGGMQPYFEGPLAELQAALHVLEEASTSRRKLSQETLSEEYFDTFDQPIADLQSVLDNLKEAPGARRRRTSDSVDAVVANDKDFKDFEAPVENLQQVVLQLGQPREAPQEAVAAAPEASGQLEPEVAPPALEPQFYRPFAGFAAISMPGEALIRQKYFAQRVPGI